MRVTQRLPPRLWGTAVLALAAALAVLFAAIARSHEPTGSQVSSAEETARTVHRLDRRLSTDTTIETLQSYLSKSPPRADLLAALGGAYLQKARETGNPVYYPKAEQVLRRALELAPEQAETLTGMGALALARHQFSEALDWGQRAVRANPRRAASYGVVADALVELGRYDEAVAVVQTMVDTRPDQASYARVSYLRELYGDVEGAIEAMRRAVSAGAPGSEGTAYVQVQLGLLFFTTGRYDEAEREFQAALQRVPDYGRALAGLALVRSAGGNDAAAIALLTKAIETMPLPEYVIALGDLYAHSGRTEEAQRQYDLARALARLQQANGADLDVELALFEADHGAVDDAAVARVRAAYARRPSIHAADALAWTLYRVGRPAEAEPYAREALRLGTKDPLKLYHAAMIARALGQNDQARAWLAQALALNPHFSVLHAAEAQQALTALGGVVSADIAARGTR